MNGSATVLKSTPLPVWVVLIQVAYIVAIAGLTISKGKFPALWLLGVAMLLGFVWVSSSRRFLAAILPFVALIICYEQLRALADDLTPAAIHITDLIFAERLLFLGEIPTVNVQAAYGTGLIPLANTVYVSHFVNPLVLAIAIWGRRREHYWHYIGGLLAISYLGFIGYILFPAAPPWWAWHFGYLGEQIWSYPSHELMLNFPNPVAAMPSLHAAYALYVATMVWWLWGRTAGLAACLIPTLMCFSTVYLAHHYVIDQIAGWLLAVPVFWLVVRLKQRGAAPSRAVHRVDSQS